MSVVDPATNAVVAKWPIPNGGSPDMGGVSADGTKLHGWYLPTDKPQSAKMLALLDELSGDKPAETPADKPADAPKADDKPAGEAAGDKPAADAAHAHQAVGLQHAGIVVGIELAIGGIGP